MQSTFLLKQRNRLMRQKNRKIINNIERNEDFKTEVQKTSESFKGC